MERNSEKKIIKYKVYTEDELYKDSIDSGTSLKGYVRTTFKNIVNIIGEPTCYPDEKVNVEWVIKFNDGRVATLYDYYQDGRTAGNFNWHIGSDVRGLEDKETVERMHDILGVEHE